VRRSIQLALVTAATVVGTMLFTPGAAHAATYDGQDPHYNNCSATASTKASKPIYLQGNSSMGTIGHIQLRYSSACRTVWARVIITTEPTGDFAEINRNSDGAWQSCYGGGDWQASLGGYSCYTPMLNDANVTSYAYGGRNVDGEQARTSNY